MDDQDFTLFIKKVKSSTGIDLAQYKEAQMKRRLTTLRNKNGYSTFITYFEAMTKDKTLFNEFLDRMTINVSEFWRNPNRWEVLENTFIPDMLERNSRIKCWSAACSSGEEPYSLAMILAEKGALARAQIIASDIDSEILLKANQGIYIERSIRDVPKLYFNRYFSSPDPLTYHIDEKLKSAIKFEKKNLLLDPFESNFDLIICRNVMIYFTEAAKSELYRKFSASLKQGGILFVGSTEQIFSPEQYQLESVGTFFYRKK